MRVAEDRAQQINKSTKELAQSADGAQGYYHYYYYTTPTLSFYGCIWYRWVITY